MMLRQAVSSQKFPAAAAAAPAAIAAVTAAAAAEMLLLEFKTLDQKWYSHSQLHLPKVLDRENLLFLHNKRWDHTTTLHMIVRSWIMRQNEFSYYRFLP